MKQFLLISIFLAHTFAVVAEEGMYPLSEIHKLNLKAKGFKISAKEIYNPDGISLVTASVNVGGCSGSFISQEGLIITNHHCAFGAVQQASTLEHDYVTNGMLARTRAEEIPAKGLTCRVIDSYRDVSKEVLAGITDTVDAMDRTKFIEQKIKAIVANTETQNKTIRAEVAEMFAGRTYILFQYKMIKDIRLVYVPPRSIGEFGGEEDNWVWPRHTGDFSFLRAYVGKDGSFAEYSSENIPYTPKKFFKVNPNGVDENDLVFILGYPGRTFRHQTSFYLAYENDIRLPYIQQRYAWMIAQMENAGKNNPEAALMLTSRIKSLANVEKNYRGKLKGFQNIPLLENKRDDERRLQAFIASDAARTKKYGDVLKEIQSVYEEIRSDAQRANILSQISGSAIALSVATSTLKLADQKQKPDLEREPAYMNRNLAALKQHALLSLHNCYAPIDKLFLREILFDAARLPKNKRIAALDTLINGTDTLGSITRFVDSAFVRTKFFDTAFAARALEMKPDEIQKLNDPLLEFARALLPELDAQRNTTRMRDGVLNKYSAKLVEVKQEWMKTDFIPDANSTLRMTFGRVRGYNPADATYFSPITTMRGVIEKNNSGNAEYAAPKQLLEEYKKKNFRRYKHSKLNDVPVAILYDCDTTGGNSGSPVLNAYGELIGVNFDRTFEATVNDYAWNQNYSRSIAVDIRYVLWVTETIGGAGFLLHEMGVQ